jgi:hypothetical protein
MTSLNYLLPKDVPEVCDALIKCGIVLPFEADWTDLRPYRAAQPLDGIRHC